MIPPMTDPLSVHWKQPDCLSILLDDIDALMEKTIFEQLTEYSATLPTGVYPGKMWRRNDGVFDPRCKRKDTRWLLGWYGWSEKGDGFCSINFREILILNFPGRLRGEALEVWSRCV